jgi:hypothetical protein
MTDLILVLSRCLKKYKKCKTQEFKFKFHFKGHYNGEFIKEIWIRHFTDDMFEVGEDYLLLVRKEKVINGILSAECIKCKKII